MQLATVMRTLQHIVCLSVFYVYMNDVDIDMQFQNVSDRYKGVITY